MNSLDLPLIAATNSLHPCIRGLTLHLLTDKKPYCNIGFFFKSLSDTDIDYLLDLYEQSECEFAGASEDDSFNALKTVTLLAYLLGRAEGETDMQPLYAKVAVPLLGTLLRVEHFIRKSNKSSNRMNYSLSTYDRIIVDNKTAEEMQEYFRDYGN